MVRAESRVKVVHLSSRNDFNGSPAIREQAMVSATSRPSRLPDDALVVRGGKNQPDDLARRTDRHPSGIIGQSVESAPGRTVEELATAIPHGQVGVTTVGKIRTAGGDVIPTSGRSPNHATMTGLSPESASELLTPTIPNPAKSKGHIHE